MLCQTLKALNDEFNSAKAENAELKRLNQELVGEIADLRRTDTSQVELISAGKIQVEVLRSELASQTAKAEEM